jgi:hypothetical protein
MTTILFTPSNNTTPPFQTPVTLDGVSYSLYTMSNFYANRWYVVLADQSGNIVMNMPLIGSPPDFDILLFPGLFQTSTVVYRVGTGQFEIGP